MKKYRGHTFYRFVLKPEYWLYGLSTRPELEEYVLKRGHGPIDFSSETALKSYMPFRKKPLQFFVDSDEDNGEGVATVTVHNTDSQGSADREETAT